MQKNLPPQAADDFYEALLDAHAGHSAEQSAALNARLILLLAGEVAELPTLLRLIAVARSAGEASPKIGA